MLVLARDLVASLLLQMCRCISNPFEKGKLLACVVFSQHHPTVAKEILHKIECHMNS